MSDLSTTFVDSPSTTTPIDAAYLNAVNAALAMTWSAWTPVVTAATTNPVLGTGSTAEGRYVRLGKLVVAQFGVQFGTSGMSAGSGEIRISLPVNMNTSGALQALGFGSGFNPTVSYSILRQSTSNMKFWIPTTASYLSAAASGWGSAGAQIWGFIVFEAA